VVLLNHSYSFIEILNSGWLIRMIFQPFQMIFHHFIQCKTIKAYHSSKSQSRVLFNPSPSCCPIDSLLFLIDSFLCVIIVLHSNLIFIRSSYYSRVYSELIYIYLSITFRLVYIIFLYLIYLFATYAIQRFTSSNPNE
jgi:hypothetical protein